jgi:ABC-2 type transport system permease protein
MTLPESLRIVAYAIPTTHASLLLQAIMGEKVPIDWSPLLGLTVQLLYLAAFVSLAKVKAIWREN